MSIVEWEVHTVGVRGGDGYLITTPGGALLVDCGFAWAGPQTLADIAAVLGPGVAPDWLVLTHSHYDHCSAAGFLLQELPGMRIAASAHAARVFERPGAWETMRRLNDSAAREQGLAEWADVPGELTLDRVLAPGDVLEAGNLHFEVVPAAGHTKCCIALWEAQQRLLVCCESAGVFNGENPTELPDGTPIPPEVTCFVEPAALVGASLALDFIARARALRPAYMVSPHHGLIKGEAACQDFFIATDFWHRYAVRRILELHAQGTPEEDIAARFMHLFYVHETANFQPRDAAELNTSIMVHRVIADATT